METPNPAKTGRRRLSFFLRGLGLVAFAYLVLSRVSLAEVAHHYHPGRLGNLVWAVPLFFVAMSVRLAKWRLLTKSLGYEERLPSLANHFLTGMLLGSVTPLRLGDAVRVRGLRAGKTSRAVRWAVLGTAMVQEKFYELAVVLGLITLGFCFVEPVVWVALLLGFASLGAVLVILIPVPTLILRWVPRKLHEGLSFLVAKWNTVTRSLTATLRIQLLALTLASYLINATGGWAIFQLFGDIGYLDFVLRLPMMTLTAAIPITFAGAGVRELTAMTLFGAMGYPESSAAVAASLYFLGANVVPTCVLPVIWLFERRAAAPLPG